MVCITCGSMTVAGRRGAALLLTGALVVFSACFILPAATDSVAEKQECYQFTWIKNENETNCKKMHEDNIPCEEPFIRTVPPDRPPNITHLNETCQKQSCPSYTCEKKAECLRWVRYDVKNKPLYMTLFCGAMLDMTKENDPNVDPKPLKNNCFLYKNVSETLEACSCDKDLCNSADGLHRSTLLAGLMVLVLFMLKKGWASKA